jgi:hypothetical protein
MLPLHSASNIRNDVGNCDPLKDFSGLFGNPTGDARTSLSTMPGYAMAKRADK